MNKYMIIIISLFIGLTACQKENDTKNVTYFIKGFTDPYKVTYTYGELSKTKTETVTPNGINSVWSSSFNAMPGEICYIYVESKEDIQNSMSFVTSILINGATFQQAKSYDLTRIVNGDTVKTIKRSGTIPF